MNETIQPRGWARPKGYANGVAARGRQIYVAGQIGWNAEQVFETDDLASQARQALENVVAVLAAGSAGPEHIVSMTWFLTDKAEYLASLDRLGQAYREVIGRHYPAMAAVEVAALIEDRAKIEIQAVAVVPD
jgi:enamine deaminase RidA (YjgF/YER057c/UK114 family)